MIPLIAASSDLDGYRDVFMGSATFAKSVGE